MNARGRAPERCCWREGVGPADGAQPKKHDRMRRRAMAASRMGKVSRMTNVSVVVTHFVVWSSAWWDNTGMTSEKKRRQSKLNKLNLFELLLALESLISMWFSKCCMPIVRLCGTIAPSTKPGIGRSRSTDFQHFPMRPTAIVLIFYSLTSPIIVRICFFHNFRFEWFRTHFRIHIPVVWEYFRKFSNNISSNFQYLSMRPVVMLWIYC